MIFHVGDVSHLYKCLLEKMAGSGKLSLQPTREQELSETAHLPRSMTHWIRRMHSGEASFKIMEHTIEGVISKGLRRNQERVVTEPKGRCGGQVRYPWRPQLDSRGREH